MDAITAPQSTRTARQSREINAEIKAAIASGSREIEVLHPGSRHSLAVGILEPARIVFRGDVGYFCGGALRRSRHRGVRRRRLVAGRRHDGRQGRRPRQLAAPRPAPSIRGGLVCVKGDAGARSGIAAKGGDRADRRLDRLHDRLHDAEGPPRGLRRRRRGVRGLDVPGRALLRRRDPGSRLGHAPRGAIRRGARLARRHLRPRSTSAPSANGRRCGRRESSGATTRRSSPSGRRRCEGSRPTGHGGNSIHARTLPRSRG